MKIEKYDKNKKYKFRLVKECPLILNAKCMGYVDPYSFIPSTYPELVMRNRGVPFKIFRSSKKNERLEKS